MKKAPSRLLPLRQALVFMLAGLMLLALLLWKVGGALRYGDPTYPVEDYATLVRHLSSNPKIILPPEEVLPAAEHINFCGYESSRSKLDPTRDGYHIGIIGDNYAYSITCSPKNDPAHQDAVPTEIRPDYVRFGTAVAFTDEGYPKLEFLVDGYYYVVDAWGSAIPDDAADTLFNMADSILQQAG